MAACLFACMALAELDRMPNAGACCACRRLTPGKVAADGGGGKGGSEYVPTGKPAMIPEPPSPPPYYPPYEAHPAGADAAVKLGHGAASGGAFPPYKGGDSVTRSPPLLQRQESFAAGKYGK